MGKGRVLLRFPRWVYGKMRKHRLETLALAPMAAQLGIFTLLFFLPDGDTFSVGIKKGDAIDLFTPIIFIPLIWLFFVEIAHDRPTTRQTIAFLAASAIWVEGYAIRSSADSIGNMIGEDRSTPGGSLIYFYDEVLGHYFWQIGMVAQSVLIIGRGWFSKEARHAANFIPFLMSGMWYGIVFFAATVEGQTVPLGIGICIFAICACLWRWHKRKFLGPAGILFMSGYALSLLLLACWGIWHGGFPEFSQVEL